MCLIFVKKLPTLGKFDLYGLKLQQKEKIFVSQLNFLLLQIEPQG